MSARPSKLRRKAGSEHQCPNQHRKDGESGRAGCPKENEPADALRSSEPAGGHALGVKKPFAAPVISKSYALRYVPDGSLCTASAEQIFPRDRVQRNCFEFALYTPRDHDRISNRIGSGIRNCPRCRSRYVRCAPNVVDDRSRDHHR